MLPSALALPSNVPLDLASHSRVKREYSASEDRAQAVVDTFKLSWEGYYKYAFPNDELKPVTNGFSNSRFIMPQDCTIS
jgi:mannosyl-oligosaccharide alpha-1,2-mannosidase